MVFCFEFPAQQPEDQGGELGEGTPGLYSLLFLFTHSFTRPLVPVVSNYSVPYTILSIEDT